MEKKKISVETFCNSYKNQSKVNEKTFNEFLQKHIINKYVDYIMKDSYCTKLVECTTHVKDGDHEFIKLNTSARYVLFMMRLIELYTDIEINFEDGIFIQQYDELNKIGALQDLISAIPKSEYIEFSSLLDMKYDDFCKNEYSTTAILYNIKQGLNLSEEVINAVLKELNKQEQSE